VVGRGTAPTTNPDPGSHRIRSVGQREQIYAGLVAARAGYVPLIMRRELRRKAATIFAKSEELEQIIRDTARRIRG
jgi:hypothetical protein